MILDKNDKLMALERMVELRDQMLDSLGEIKQIIQEIAGREDRGMCFERARSYWLTHVENNLSAEKNSFLGSMVNFESTLNDLREVIDSETGHEDECDCVPCAERRQPGNLDYDPTNTDDEAERAEEHEEE